MPRLYYLDSIRGIAAILVLLHHVIIYFIEKDIQVPSFFTELLKHVELGRMGVILFFLTSGFVIPWSLNEKDTSPVRSFAIKRFFRLYPAYWFSMFFAIVFGGVGVGISVDSVEQVLVNITMIQRFLGVENVNLAYWTLHLELVFYFICAVLFYFGFFKTNSYIFLFALSFSFLALVCAFIRYKYDLRLPIVWPLGLASMFIGALFREALLGGQRSVKIQLGLVLLVFFSVLIITHNLYFREGWVKWYVSYVLAFVSFFVLCTILKLENMITVFFGKISYSMYLLHSVVIGLFYVWLGDSFVSKYGFYVSCVIVFSASVFVSWIAYRYIEVPSVKVGRIAVNKINSWFFSDLEKT